MASVAIIGAGVFGSSLAWWLAREGSDVTLVDQFEPGDPRATSGGETRLLRCAHGEDALYGNSAWRARTLWRELEADCGEALLVECGVAWFAHREDGWEATSERVLRALAIPCERVDAAGLFASFAGDDVAFTLLEPHAGVWLVGGGSGHGFKHGPALAERIAAAWAGERPLPAEWGLGRRVPGRSLRTAGATRF